MQKAAKKTRDALALARRFALSDVDGMTTKLRFCKARAVATVLLMAAGLLPDPARAAKAARPLGEDALFKPASPEGVASALPRSPLEDIFVMGALRFDDAAEAHRSCPSDVVVRVRFFANRYRWERADGTAEPQEVFMCQADASSEGDRPPRPKRKR